MFGNRTGESFVDLSEAFFLKRIFAGLPMEKRTTMKSTRVIHENPIEWLIVKQKFLS